MSYIIKMNDPFGNERYHAREGSAAELISSWADNRTEAKHMTEQEAATVMVRLESMRDGLIKAHGPRYKKMRFQIIEDNEPAVAVTKSKETLVRESIDFINKAAGQDERE